MREKPFLESHQEDGGKLQPLGGVQGHQLHRVLILFERIEIADQRNSRQESFQIGIVGQVFELACDVDEFAQVLNTTEHQLVARRSGFLGNFVHVAGFFENHLHQLRDRHGTRHGAPAIDADGEVLQRLALFGWDAGDARRVVSRIHHRPAFCIGKFLQAIESGFPESAARIVDDSVECLTIRCVVDKTQIRHDVFNFGPVVKSRASHHCVGDIAAHQDFFNRSALGVGSVEQDATGELEIPGFQAFEFVDHKVRFVDFVDRRIAAHLAALLTVAAQDFVDALIIVFDDAVGGVQNGRSGAIVLFQLDQLRVGKVCLEAENNSKVRFAP